MNIPVPNSDNTFKGSVQDLIYSTFMYGECCGHQEIEVTELAVVALTVPTDTVLAIATVTPDPNTVDQAAAIHFKCWDTTNTPPTSTLGLPLGKGGVRVFTGPDLTNARFIGIEAGMTHTLKVEYRK